MILVADNLQITRQTVADAIQHQKPERLQALVQAMEAAGADAIDLNTGPLGRDAARKMTFCVETVQAATDLPILIDTANPLAMKAGLEANRKVAVINGISLEPQKLEAILPLAVEYDVDMIGYLLDATVRCRRTRTTAWPSPWNFFSVVFLPVYGRIN